MKNRTFNTEKCPNKKFKKKRSNNWNSDDEFEVEEFYFGKESNLKTKMRMLHIIHPPQVQLCCHPWNTHQGVVGDHHEEEAVEGVEEGKVIPHQENNWILRKFYWKK